MVLLMASRQANLACIPFTLTRMFILYSLVWMACDAIFLKPVFDLFTSMGICSQSYKARAGLSECFIAICLGSIAGFWVGPMIAFSFTTRVWSWVATAALIGTSCLVFSLRSA